MTPTITQIRQRKRMEVQDRRTTIHTLIKKLSRNRGWKKAFLESNPTFNNNVGITMITNAHTGRVSDAFFLEALQTFDVAVEIEQPEWYTKPKTNA